MSKISILDCTLRDGGYVNNWQFGKKIMREITKSLFDASIEIIECGFVSDVKKSNEENSIFSSIDEAEKFFCNSGKHNLAVMINCGEYDADKTDEYNGGSIKTVRIAFHKHQIDSAKKLFSDINKKGYDIFLQPMYTMGYSDFELLSLIEWANDNNPAAVYLVDTFGTMRKKDLLRMFYLVDNNLKSEIKIGFHSHNNLQLSFSNAQELMALNSGRDIIIDTSVFGMGRGAGNLCTELMTQYINENIEKKYDVIPILEAMDEYIMPIYSDSPWGYSVPYYIAAVNDCHPNYATFLINKQTLSIRDMNSIIKSIPVDNRHFYDEKKISQLYSEYLSHNVDDTAAVAQLAKFCKNRTVLVLAPGKSILTQKEKIKRFISENDPVIIAINHIPELYGYDKIFISNLKRFKSIDDATKKIGDKLLCTSNISTDSRFCIFNYSSYLNDDESISDNAGIMLLNVLYKCGVRFFNLAGFDGFDCAGKKNYYDDKMINNVSAEKQEAINKAIINYFGKKRNKIEINFVTPTIYSEKNST